MITKDRLAELISRKAKIYVSRLGLLAYYDFSMYPDVGYTIYKDTLYAAKSRDAILQEVVPLKFIYESREKALEVCEKVLSRALSLACEKVKIKDLDIDKESSCFLKKEADLKYNHFVTQAQQEWEADNDVKT